MLSTKPPLCMNSITIIIKKIIIVKNHNIIVVHICIRYTVNCIYITHHNSVRLTINYFGI